MASRVSLLGLIGLGASLAGGAGAAPAGLVFPRRRRDRARPGDVLEQRHGLLPAYRSLPERRSHQRSRAGPCSGRSGAPRLRGWRPGRGAPEDRGGLLRQPGRHRHLDDALRGADPGQRRRGNRKDLRLSRLLDAGLDGRGPGTGNHGRSPRGGGRGPPARHPRAHGCRHQPHRPGDARIRPGPTTGFAPAPTAPTGTTPPRWTAPWWRPCRTSAPSGRAGRAARGAARKVGA